MTFRYLLSFLMSMSLSANTIYLCTTTSVNKDGKIQDVSDEKPNKFEVTTNWYGKPTGLLLYRNNNTVGVVPNIQTKIQWLQDDVIKFQLKTTEVNLKIEMEKGETPILKFDAMDLHHTIATFQCVQQ